VVPLAAGPAAQSLGDVWTTHALPLQCWSPGQDAVTDTPLEVEDPHALEAVAEHVVEPAFDAGRLPEPLADGESVYEAAFAPVHDIVTVTGAVPLEPQLTV